LAITPLNAVSFIADFTGPVTIVVQHATIASSESNYTLQAVTGDLAIGTPRTGSTYSERIYYSFEAQSGTAYQVRRHCDLPRSSDAALLRPRVSRFSGHDV
jgi:hypothetical protein